MATVRLYQAREIIKSDNINVSNVDRIAFETKTNETTRMFDVTSIKSIFDVVFGIMTFELDITENVYNVIKFHFNEWDVVMDNISYLTDVEVKVSDVFGVATNDDTFKWNLYDVDRTYGQYKITGEWHDIDKGTIKAIVVYDTERNLSVTLKTDKNGKIKQRVWGIGRTFDIFTKQLANVVLVDINSKRKGAKGKINVKYTLESPVTVTVNRK